MFYDPEQAKAREAVRITESELRKWERRYDHHRGADATHYIARIKSAERRHLKALEQLRLLRDGRRERLPETAVAEAPGAPLGGNEGQPMALRGFRASRLKPNTLTPDRRRSHL